MNKRIVLDTGPLGRVTHPKEKENRAATEWLRSMAERDCEIILAEIADYELRREYLHRDNSKSLNRLNQLKKILEYIPIDTATMEEAASLWAKAGKRGKSTADPKELDGDAILAAQARRANAVIATENVGHLQQFVSIENWREIGFHRGQ